MYASIIISLLIVPAQASLARVESNQSCWKIDKHTVMVGGAVTIDINEKCTTKKLSIVIDDRIPISLIEQAGPTLQYTTIENNVIRNTYVLISHDLYSKKSMSPVQGEPNTFRYVPIFYQPGKVELSLVLDDEIIDTKIIKVIPVSEEAYGAIDLLYPKIVRNKGADPKDILWLQLLMYNNFGSNSKLTHDQRSQLHEELAIIKKHPDWAEIFDMLIARMDIKLDVLSIDDRVRKLQNLNSETITLPSIPRAVQNAIQVKCTSPYAKGIQDNIRDIVTHRKRITDRITKQQQIKE